MRGVNFVAGTLLAYLVGSLLYLNVEAHDVEYEGEHEFTAQRGRRPARSGWQLIHTIINIHLFPPLFFFYGLYYTDVLSAYSVLFVYRCYLTRQRNILVFAGLFSLLFRQTNIFWVSVFLGGLDLCKSVPKGRPEAEFPIRPSFYDVIEGSWQHAKAYDPFISQACFEGYNGTLFMQSSY